MKSPLGRGKYLAMCVLNFEDLGCGNAPAGQAEALCLYFGTGLCQSLLVSSVIASHLSGGWRLYKTDVCG